MAGERILMVDSSASVQDMTRAMLEEHGFRVATASNGMAAVSHPEISKFDMVLIDSGLDGVDGLDTSAQIRTEAETYGVPILLLVPEDELEPRSNQSLRGANGFIAKPFAPAERVVKVREIIEEKRLKSLSEQYLEEQADRHMQGLAETKIQQAVERKIQIIVERAIQSIVSIIDQRARREVDARVTALTAEKEQELVRMTVQEVARSMVEKLAERKVTEAMEAILVETTEKTVKRAADSMLPSLVRERLKESLETTLPREVQTRVDKATLDKMSEFSEALVNVLQAEAKKTVPLVAKEKLPEIAERVVATACETRVPQLVQQEARGSVANELQMRIRPLIDSEARKIKRSSLNWVFVIVIVMLILACANGYMLFTVWSQMEKNQNEQPQSAITGVF